MDVKEYIASGVVELYVMNSLPVNEKKEFERNILLYPEISEELRNVSAALEHYSEGQAINPPPQLRARIVGSHVNGKDVTTKTKSEKQANKNSSVLAYKYLIAASLAALVISTFASWFFYSRWEEAEDRFTNLLDDKNELAESYNLVKQTYDENLAKLFVMRDPATKMIELRSADTTSRFLSRVYWNKETRRTYIDVLVLPEPADGKQYQLWAINSGQPVDAGVCSADARGLQQVKEVENATGWLLSLEDKGVALKPSIIILRSE